MISVNTGRFTAYKIREDQKRGSALGSISELLEAQLAKMVRSDGHVSVAAFLLDSRPE